MTFAVFKMFLIMSSKMLRNSLEGHDNPHEIYFPWQQCFLERLQSIETNEKFFFSVVLSKTSIENDIFAAISRDKIRITENYCGLNMNLKILQRDCFVSISQFRKSLMSYNLLLNYFKLNYLKCFCENDIFLHLVSTKAFC